MSEKKSNSVIASISKLAIVRKAMAFLNLGEEGKLESFYSKVINTLSKEKKILNQNIDQLKFNHSVEIEALEEKLEDAQEAFEHSKIDVDLSKIHTNADQTNYVDIFLNNMDKKALEVKSIESQIAASKETFEKSKKEYEDLIESLDKRIGFLSIEE